MMSGDFQNEQKFIIALPKHPFLGNKYMLDIQIPKKNPTFFAQYTHGFNFSPCTIRNK